MPKTEKESIPLKKLIQLVWIFATLVHLPKLYADVLPYSARHLPYSGWNTSVHGDIRTIGMGGATAALGDSFLASTDNPAGLAMTFQGVDINYTDNTIQDGNLQNYAVPISLTSTGIAVNNYPWGFSVGAFNPYREEANYLMNSSGTQPILLENNIAELRLGVSRMFEIKDQKLALGLAWINGTATETLNGNSVLLGTMGLTLSAMMELPKRTLLGVAYQFPMGYSASGAQNDSLLPGFYQAIEVPSRFSFGLGWIPNRNFKMGFTFGITGQTPNAALLSNDQVSVGKFNTYQPRVGAGYTLADFKFLETKFYLGSYLENSRITGSSRLHATTGLDARFWFITVGFAADVSANYLNKSFGFGLDIIRVLTLLDLVPKQWHPPYSGLMPDPTEFSDIGLARPLVENWVAHNTLNPIKVGMEFPDRIEKKFIEIRNDLESLTLKPETKEEQSKPTVSVPKKIKSRKKRKKPKKTKIYSNPTPESSTQKTR